MRLRYPGFVIADGVVGKRMPAAVKSRYRVIEYLEPMTGNEPAFGFDTSSQPFLDNVIRRTTDIGLPAATGLYPISKETGVQRGFRLLMPVYQGGAAPDDLALRRRAVVGYTIAQLRADALFEKILAPVGAPGNVGLDIRVYASASVDESKLIYGLAGTATKQRDWLPLEWWLGSRSEPVVHGFDVAGTAWQMVVSLKPTPLLATHSSSLLALLIGLLTTVSATVYLRSAALRTQRIEQLVAQRTEELKKANDFLIDDILLRRQTEQALVSSEEHMRELAELSSDWFWEQDEQFRYTALTGEACKSGLLTEDLLGRTRWDLPVDPKASDWPAHRALLEAHQPFKNFEFKALSTIQVDGLPVQWLSASGKPQFDDQGCFKGYRGTSENISVRKWAEEELIHSRAELRKLADHQATVTENERKRIARDIHDDLGQHLMALRIDMSVLAAGSAAVTVSKEWIDATLKQIDAAITAVRAIINDLRPAMLDFGLHAAIEWQATKFEQRTGIACQLQLGNDEVALNDQCATALFRIVQEALTNIQRHARARQVRIDMQRTDNRLLMTIADDGIGVAAKGVKKPDSFGLIGIEERIGALGGTLSIVSNPGQGMALVLSIPLQTHEPSLVH